jgi:hypothetical protein
MTGTVGGTAGIETVGIILPFPPSKDLEIKKSELHLKKSY